MPRTQPPLVRTTIPGPASRALAERLARVESHNVTCFETGGPIFWERAAGANVWDVDGNRFVDLGAGFGVAVAGHNHPDIVRAIGDQASQLLHAMGDIHPPRVKVELLERLCAIYPGGAPARGVLMSSGSDAIETALKTSLLATGRAGVIAFEGGYHGLSLGALDTTWRRDFREPFAARLPAATRFARYGDVESVAEVAEGPGPPVGAVLVEPVQGRGGERIPPSGFLSGLRRLCDERGWLLIADEIYTGFGRTGRWFGCDHESVIPDLLCAGKGMTSGMPLSVCLGRAEVMQAWPVSNGEALHTQTFLGHPLCCRAALACLDVLEGEKLVERSATLGGRALDWLREGFARHPSVKTVRGRGLMIGVECGSGEVAGRAQVEALRQGVIVLPSGPAGEVISITPPLTIDSETFRKALATLAAALPR